MDLIKKGYWGLVQGENFLGNIFLFLVRLYWGILIAFLGLEKFLHLPDIAIYFSSLGISTPYCAACIAATVELLGGISLALGLFSRISSLLLAILLSTAYALAHKGALTSFFSKPSLFIAQEPFLYFYTVLVILCFGPGLFSIDYWLERKTYGQPL